MMVRVRRVFWTDPYIGSERLCSCLAEIHTNGKAERGRRKDTDHGNHKKGVQQSAFNTETNYYAAEK